MNKKIQFLTDYNEIEKCLKQYNIQNYTIKNDGVVNVNGDVKLYYELFEYFPVKFGTVSGNFSYFFNINLKTLEGAPKKCKKFSVSTCNKLKTLKGAPEQCIHFNCECCENLKSLEGAPRECNTFDCYKCENLKSLKGAPEKCEYFHCSMCNNLETLKHSPKECKYFDCSWCKNLKSLKGAPEECEEFTCHNCINLKTLKRAPKKCKEFDCSKCHKLEYSLKYFPTCKKIRIYETPLESLYISLGGKSFIELINAKTKFKFESILAEKYALKKINFETDIFPLLKDKSITLDKFKYIYRGIISGQNFNF